MTGLYWIKVEHIKHALDRTLPKKDKDIIIDTKYFDIKV